MKIDMKKVRTYLIKVIVVAVLMGIMTCGSVFAAGFSGNDSTGNTGSTIEDDRDKETVKLRLNEWCSFVSDGSVGGWNISEKAKQMLTAPSDRAKIVDGVPYAKMIDTDVDGRSGTREASEQVLEYGGYYYYYIKKQMVGEGEGDFSDGQLRRVYYKYVELKKEELCANEDNRWV